MKVIVLRDVTLGWDTCIRKDDILDVGERPEYGHLYRVRSINGKVIRTILWCPKVSVAPLP